MELSKDDIDDMFVSIAFNPPRTHGEMRAYYELYKTMNTNYTLSDIFYLLGLTKFKVEAFAVKMSKKWSVKELEHSVNYSKQFNTEIRAILELFVKK